MGDRAFLDSTRPDAVPSPVDLMIVKTGDSERMVNSKTNGEAAEDGAGGAGGVVDVGDALGGLTREA